MIFVTLSDDGTQVTSIFNYPQNDPKPHGYAVIPNNDMRFSVYLQEQTQEQQVSP